MTTIIFSNGSKWMGEQPDTVEQLLTVLGSRALDRRFEGFGNFIMPLAHERPEVRDGLSENAVQFWGNFFDFSHVFDIRTDDQDVIERLTAAIRANQQRADYLAQQSA